MMSYSELFKELKELYNNKYNDWKVRLPIELDLVWRLIQYFYEPHVGTLKLTIGDIFN